MSWLTPVLTMRGRGPLAVALALYHQAGLERSDTVRMTEKLRERFHVNKRTASRALARMESAGLIQVIRRPGCCHVVEILRHQ